MPELHVSFALERGRHKRTWIESELAKDSRARRCGGRMKVAHRRGSVRRRDQMLPVRDTSLRDRYVHRRRQEADHDVGFAD